MRIRTHLAAAAVLTAGFVLAAPVAHAATPLPQANSSACTAALNAAQTAENAYNDAVTALKQQIAAGGHPGTAENDNVASLLSAANAATSAASRICLTTPVGPVTAGVGSTSQGADTTSVLAGAGLMGLAGFGAVALRRRANGSQA